MSVDTKLRSDKCFDADSTSRDHADLSTAREDRLLDTVGAVCVDQYGNVASAVSSGGIVLKQSGRLGQVSS